MVVAASDTLRIRSAHFSATGTRARNEDFVGMVVPEVARELQDKGIIAAIADGVSGAGGGREAAEYTVRGVLTDYYATPDTWETTLALDRVIGALNRWVIAQGQTRAELHGMATTLTTLIIKNGRYILAHIGDTRCYLLRGTELLRLTQDHVWDRPDMQHVLTRAVGLDQRLHMDYAEGDVQVGDCFVLLSDGAWEPLLGTGLAPSGPRARKTQRGEAQLRALLDQEDAARAICDAALAAGGQDNATALTLRIDALGATTFADLSASAKPLPTPAKLKAGQAVDGFAVLNVLHESRSTLLYTVRDQASGQTFVLKALHPALGDDAQAREAFAREEWLARRVISPHFAQYVPLAAERRSQLYFVMTWHQGATLQQQLDHGQHFTVPEAIDIGIKLLKGLSVLHRLDVLHRDIKPANIHIGQDGQLRVLDLGVAQVQRRSTADAFASNEVDVAGTPSFLAPEQFDGAPPSRETDLYAVAVTLIHLLTRRYPYGEIEPFQRPRFTEPASPARTRRDIPQWLDKLLVRGAAKDPKQRFETCEEFILALERGVQLGDIALPQGSASTARAPLAERDPLRLWQWIAVSAMALNVLLLYLLLVR